MSSSSEEKKINPLDVILTERCVSVEEEADKLCMEIFELLAPAIHEKGKEVNESITWRGKRILYISIGVKEIDDMVREWNDYKIKNVMDRLCDNSNANGGSCRISWRIQTDTESYVRVGYKRKCGYMFDISISPK